MIPTCLFLVVIIFSTECASFSLRTSTFLETVDTPHQSSFKRLLESHSDQKVCLFQVGSTNTHGIRAGCISTRSISSNDIQKKRNSFFSIFSALKVQIEEWKCESETIQTPGVWFHISDLTLDDADDWIGFKSDEPGDNEMVNRAVKCHQQHDSTVSAEGFPPTDRTTTRRRPAALPSTSCSITFEEVCLKAKTLNLETKDLWLAPSTVNDVCGKPLEEPLAIMDSELGEGRRKKRRKKCCQQYFQSIVDIVTSPCQSRGPKNAWEKLSDQSWNTMCVQQDYANLVGVETDKSPWMVPTFPTW